MNSWKLGILSNTVELSNKVLLFRSNRSRALIPCQNGIVEEGKSRELESEVSLDSHDDLFVIFLVIEDRFGKPNEITLIIKDNYLEYTNLSLIYSRFMGHSNHGVTPLPMAQ